MIALRIDFLAGRFHAAPWSRDVRGGDIEWPPNPWRVLRAIVAAALRDEEGDRSELLSLLDKLADPPMFHVPPSAEGRTLYYAPAAEGSAEELVLARDSFLALDRGRGRVASAFVIYRHAALTEGERALLEACVSRIGDLGAPESWCELTLCDDPPLPNVDLASHKEGSEAIVQRLAAVRGLRGEALLAALTTANGAIGNGKRRLPAGAEFVDYRFDGSYGRQDPAAAAAREGAAAFAPRILRFALKGAESGLPSSYDTLAVAEALRAAAMSTYSAIHARVATGMLAGKSLEGAKATGQTHAFYLPQDTNEAGSIDAIDVWLPAGCSHEEYRALTAIKRLYYRLLPREHPGFSLAFLGPIEPSVARVWESSTALVLDRFPKASALAVDQLGSALERRGHEVESIEVWAPRRQIELRGGRGLRIDAFRKERLGKSAPLPPMVGATLRFRAAVRGPLVLGRLAHFGLGQFRPSK